MLNKCNNYTAGTNLCLSTHRWELRSPYPEALLSTRQKRLSWEHPSAVVFVLWSFTFSKMDPFPSSFMISLIWSMVRNEVWHTDMAASFSSSLFTSSGTDFTGLKGSWWNLMLMWGLLSTCLLDLPWSLNKSSLGLSSTLTMGEKKFKSCYGSLNILVTYSLNQISSVYYLNILFTLFALSFQLYYGPRYKLKFHIFSYAVSSSAFVCKITVII